MKLLLLAFLVLGCSASRPAVQSIPAPGSTLGAVGEPDAGRRTEAPTPFHGASPSPTVAPRPTLDRSTSASVSGLASWYEWHPGQAAAGPALRVGHWRGRVVKVCRNGLCWHFVLSDWCQCYGNRLIDLNRDDFAAMAPLSRGLIEVTVSW